MLRCLLAVAAALIGLAPAGVGVGLALAVNIGCGVAAGSALYGAVGVFLLLANLLPEPSQAREVTR